MKILLVTSSFPPHYSGVATATINLAEQLAKKHQTAVLTTTVSKENETISLNSNLTVYKVPGIILSRPRSITIPYPYSKSVATIIRRVAPDVIHLQDIGPVCLESFSVGKQLKIPLVITHHFTAEFIIKTILPEGQITHLLSQNDLLKKLIYGLVKFFYNYCSLVTVPNARLIPFFQQAGLQTPIVSIPNGVLLKRFRRRPRLKQVKRRHQITQSKLILNVSRLDADKNLNILIDAFALISRNNPDAALVLVGKGNQKQKLLQQVKALKLNKQVYFLGQIDNHNLHLSELYNSATIFASASIIENQSVAFIEAMTAGLPLVLAKTAISENDQIGGLKFEPGNAGALAVCLQQLLSDRKLRQTLGRANRKAGRQYDIAITSRQYLQAYQSLKT